MQQIFYQQSPQVVLVYPEYLQAYNTSRWTGWTPMFHGRGPAFVDDRHGRLVRQPAAGDRHLERRRRQGRGHRRRGSRRGRHRGRRDLADAAPPRPGGGGVSGVGGASGASGTSGASGAARDAARPADSALLNGVVYTADGAHRHRPGRGRRRRPHRRRRQRRRRAQGLRPVHAAHRPRGAPRAARVHRQPRPRQRDGRRRLRRQAEGPGIAPGVRGGGARPSPPTTRSFPPSAAGAGATSSSRGVAPRRPRSTPR